MTALPTMSVTDGKNNQLSTHTQTKQSENGFTNLKKNIHKHTKYDTNWKYNLQKLNQFYNHDNAVKSVFNPRKRWSVFILVNIETIDILG